jgi:hypothetical protein
MDYSNSAEVTEHIVDLDRMHPNWREDKHPNGRRKWSDDGMLLNSDGSRSIFDDVDE